MDEQVAHSHLARHPGIVHLKPGDMVDHLVVPGDLALVDQDGEGCDGNGLARRSGREDGIGVDGRVPSQLSNAIALGQRRLAILDDGDRSEEHTSELQSLMRISYAVFCLKKKNKLTLCHTTPH